MLNKLNGGGAQLCRHMSTGKNAAIKPWGLHFKPMCTKQRECVTVVFSGLLTLCNGLLLHPFIANYRISFFFFLFFHCVSYHIFVLQSLVNAHPGWFFFLAIMSQDAISRELDGIGTARTWWLHGLLHHR